MTKTIAAVTGTRAEYGILKPVFQAIQNHPELKLKVIATGMHLQESFGNTVTEIEKDFDIAARVPMNVSNDTTHDTAYAFAEGIKGTTAALEQIKPDIFLVVFSEARRDVHKLFKAISRNGNYA